MSKGLLVDAIAESDPIARGKTLFHRYCERAGKADDNSRFGSLFWPKLLTAQSTEQNPSG